MADMPSGATASAGKPPKWRRWPLEAAIFVALLAVFQLWQLRDAARGPAPQFTAPRSDGTTFDLAAWRAEHPGRPLLLYFWADWCTICKTTAGNAAGLAANWPVMAVAIQSGPPEKIAKILVDRGYGFTSLADPAAAIHRQYGLPGVPAFVVIDPAGNISASSLGYASEIGLRARLWLASLKTG